MLEHGRRYSLQYHYETTDETPSKNRSWFCLSHCSQDLSLSLCLGEQHPSLDQEFIWDSNNASLESSCQQGFKLTSAADSHGSAWVKLLHHLPDRETVSFLVRSDDVLVLWHKYRRRDKTIVWNASHFKEESFFKMAGTNCGFFFH